jgi:hypothetical protein
MMPKDYAEKKEYLKEYRAKNSKTLVANSIRWKNKFPERNILTRAKTRAKKFNIDFTIDETDIVIPEKCPILGIPITKTDGLYLKGPQLYSLSIDRIDNTKGYVKGNICIISHQANVMKNSASPEELLKFAYWVILTYGHLIDKEIS